ncbi:hypothetical protein [Spiroplasma endosymbiont of Calodromius spilotus]|uniref:hypothetical protein n=1 Tax=Spiroplasma endosymbiont of Calodromius spilotus TaxID=3077929 RepID=UPI0031FE9243
MKILNIMAILGLTTLPITACACSNKKQLSPAEPLIINELNLSNVKIQITYNYNDKYEIDFYNIKKEEIINIPKWLKYDGTSSCEENWRPNCGLKSLHFEKNDIVWNELKRLKITIKNDKIFDKTEFIASNTHVKIANETITTPIKILSFKAELKK